MTTAAALPAPVPTLPTLLSIGQVASQLGVGRSLVYAEIRGGNLPTVRVGGRRLVSVDALAAYIAANTSTSIADES